MRRALLLINPDSCRAFGMRAEAAARLKDGGLELLDPGEEDPSLFPEVIRAHAGRIDLAIVGGGDGTLNTVIAPLREIGCPLGVLPVGTANNFARNLRIPFSLAGACDAAAGGRPAAVDLGEAAGRYFLNAAGLGVSTEINRAVNKRLKRRWGMLVYFLAAAKLLKKVKPFTADISSAGESRKVKVFQVTICNGRHYGAGLSIHPEATIRDASLDLCAITMSGWPQLFSLLPALVRGRPDQFRGACLMRGSEFAIRTRKPHRIDTDGEITAETPATFKVLPNAFQVILPP